jgi:hypothetical protein
MEHAAAHGAFQSLGNGSSEAAAMRRALMAWRMVVGPEAAAVDDSLMMIADQPAELELGLLTARFADFERYFGADHEITHTALAGSTPRQAARALIENSVLGSADRTRQAVAEGTIDSGDPLVNLAAVLMPYYVEFQRGYSALEARERQLASDLGRARFEVYGGEIPPAATSSPRITDGVVRRYEHNGTLAPPYTTFFGLYDRYSSHKRKPDWELPARWRQPPRDLDLSTPLTSYPPQTHTGAIPDRPR